MGHVFVSHSSKDRAQVARLASLLDAQHTPYFLDYDPELGIPAGRRWEDELYYRLAGCEVVLYVCSENSNASKWCFAELAQARALRRTVVALRLSGAALPSLLTDTHAVVDFDAPAEEVRARLRNALALSASAAPERFPWDGRRALYPGMLAFDEADAAIFFGRDDETRDLLGVLDRARVSDTRLVCVGGASGSGKSSVVRAGALPRLRRRRDDWIVCGPVIAGPMLLDQLAERLIGCFAGKAPAFGTVRKALAALAREAAPDPAPLDALLRKLRLAGGGRAERSLLCVIDQGERLFAPDASASLRLLGACAAARALPLQIVLTLRSDHIDRLQACLAAVSARCEWLSIGPMAAARVAQVIEGPAQLARLRIEPALVATMVADAGRDDGLPLLAFALHELWQRRGRDQATLSLADYTDVLGGLEGCVARRAEAVVAALQPAAEQLALLRRTMTRMARLGDGERFVSQPIAIDSVAPTVRPIIDRLVDERLLVTRDTQLEVAHEALLRAWDALRGWLDADRRFLAWQRDCAAGLRAFVATGRDIAAVHLSGQALAAAQAWLATHREAMGAEAAAWVEASMARAERAERLSREAQIRHLAAQGQVILACDPPEVGERGLLLAIEALQQARDLPSARFEADQALRQGLALLGRRVQAVDAGSDVAAHAWAAHPKAPIVAFGSADARVRVWNLQTRAVEDLPRLSAAVDLLRFSADGRWMAASGGGRVLLWDLQANKLVSIAAVLPAEPEAEFGAASAMAFSRAGDMLAVAFVHRCLLWQTAQPEQPALALPESATPLVSLDFSADGSVLVEQGLGGPAVCWRWRDGARIGAIGEGGNQVLVSADGRWVGSAGPGSYVASLWDTYLRESHRLANNGAKLAFSADSQWVAMASPEHFAKLWRLPERSVAQRWRHHAEVWDLDFSPDGKKLITQAKNGVAHVWDTDEGVELARLIHAQTLRGVRFAGDSRLAVTLSAAGTLTAWDSEELRHPRTLQFRLATLGVAFSPDGRLLAVGVREGLGAIAPHLIDLENLQAVAELRLAADGPAVNAADHARQLLDAQRQASAAATRSASGRWQTLQPSKKELTVVDGALDADAARSAVPRCTLRHDHEVRHAIFSPDEQHLATVSEGDHVRVWDLAQGVEISRLTLPLPNVADAAFSPDGRIIATAGWDGLVRLWWWRVQELVADARGRVTRELSADERQRHVPEQPEARASAAARPA